MNQYNIISISPETYKNLLYIARDSYLKIKYLNRGGVYADT
jgi:hypothetical protein